MDVTVLASLLAGALACLSPSVLPLGPPYLAYLPGASLERLADAVTQLALLPREKRLAVGRPLGLWGDDAMGLAFAFGWTPCIGPILAAILAVAASKATVAKGAGLLAVYSLGLGAPFVIAAFAVEPFAAFLTLFKAHLAHVERVMGGLLVLTGIGFLAGF